MQDYRNRVANRDSNRVVAYGCAWFLVLVGVGLLGLSFAAAVTLIR